MKFCLEACDLGLKAGDFLLFRDLTFSLPQEKMIAIIGANGVGKSTLLKVIMGYLSVFSGQLKVMGFPFRELDKKNYRKIAYLAQEINIDWYFPITVFEVVAMGIYARRAPSIFLNGAEKMEIEKVLDKLHLRRLKDESISCLSGGEKRRMLLARALLQDAQLYLLDEPFAGVDVKSVSIMLDIFKMLVLAKKTVLVVNHDLASVRNSFDWCLALSLNVERGCYEGPCSEVMSKEKISQIFSWQ